MWEISWIEVKRERLESEYSLSEYKDATLRQHGYQLLDSYCLFLKYVVKKSASVV